MTMPESGPKPSRTRATASFLTGFMMFGGAGALAAAASQRQLTPVDAPPIPRTERIQLNLLFLAFYAGTAGGGIIGWMLTHSFWGVFVGVFLGMLGGWCMGVVILALVALTRWTMKRISR